MKLVNLLSESKFGPGSQVGLSVHPDWKVQYGTIENKRRPEAIYITLSTWVKPKLKAARAISGADLDANETARAAAKEFESELKQLQSKVRTFFDSLYFEPDSIIFIYDYVGVRAEAGKSQFLEIEINIDTVNDIDSRGEPAPNKKTGKVEYMHFDEFKTPVKQAVTKILSHTTFARATSVEFNKTKR